MQEIDPKSLLAMMDSLGTKGIIGTAIVGFVAGALAKFIVPGKDPGGFILTTLLGIGGSYAATYLGHRFGLFSAGQVSGFVAAIVGAIVILFLYRIIFRRS